MAPMGPMGMPGMAGMVGMASPLSPQLAQPAMPAMAVPDPNVAKGQGQGSEVHWADMAGMGMCQAMGPQMGLEGEGAQRLG